MDSVSGKEEPISTVPENTGSEVKPASDTQRLLPDDEAVRFGRWCPTVLKKRHILVYSSVVVLLLAVASIFVLVLYPYPHSAPTTVILVSFDGFRFDYLTNYSTPNLDRLAKTGYASPLQSVWPSKTFPNHYTIATGLYPESHGIVSNTVYDPVFNATFAINDPGAVTDPRWWLGTPIWVTAEKAHLRAGVYFWPGSEAPIDGIRPTFYLKYNQSVPYKERVRTLGRWMNLPVSERPRFMAVYFDLVDTAGHKFGPYSPEVEDAVLEADDLVGQLLDEVSASPVSNNVAVVVVADHGMAQVSINRTIAIDDYVDLSTVMITDWTPVMGLWPRGEDGAVTENKTIARELYSRLLAVPHAQPYLRATTPSQFHYRNSDRIPPVLLACDNGWSVGTREEIERNPSWFEGGAHGFDPSWVDMQGLFVAGGGPLVAHGVRSDDSCLLNIDLYPLLCSILSIPPAPSNGTLSHMQFLLGSTDG